MSPEGTRPTRLAGRVAVTFAGLMHLMVGAFVLASARVMPLPVALGLGLLWAVVASLIWRWRHVRSIGVLLLPFVVAAAWWAAAVTFSER